MNNFKNGLDETGLISFEMATGDGGTSKVIFDRRMPMRTPSLVCKYGKTTVLTTLSLKKIKEDGKKLDFLPLSVFFIENLYSKGKLPSSLDLNEGKTSTSAILSSRLIDHSIRPCFSVYDNVEIQLVNTVLSYDEKNDPRLPAVWNSSLIPIFSRELSFDKVISTVFVAEVDGKLVYNPSPQELSSSPFEFTMSASCDKIMTVEMFSKELSEKRVLEIINFAFERIRSDVEKIKDHFLIRDNQLDKKIVDDFCNYRSLDSKIDNFFAEFSSSKGEWNEKRNLLDSFVEEILHSKEDAYDINVLKFWNIKLRDFVTRKMNQEGIRIDGRTFEQIRDITITNDYLPEQVHGSSLFSRGNTTVLSSVTYGKLVDKKLPNSLFTTNSIDRRFFSQYKFHSYSVGELSLNSKGNLSRREVGHGNLVGRTFKRFVPSGTVFSYTTRIVSEVLSSEGSSSQASICASSLALISSGFPLPRCIAGVSLGIIGDKIIVDVNDIEDRIGSIDLKIAGTVNGICSFQMDVKDEGVSAEKFFQCLVSGKNARLKIIKQMENSLLNIERKFPDSAVKYEKLYVGSEGLKAISKIIGTDKKNANFLKEKLNLVADLEIIERDNVIVFFHRNQDEVAVASRKVRELLSSLSFKF